MNRYCYCQRPIQRFENLARDSFCRICCKPSIARGDKVLYACGNSQCFYKKISTQPYIICNGCYDLKNNDEGLDINQDRNSFTYNKFKANLNTIS